jgi:serine/threonine protein kinase
MSKTNLQASFRAENGTGDYVDIEHLVEDTGNAAYQRNDENSSVNPPKVPLKRESSILNLAKGAVSSVFRISNHGSMENLNEPDTNKKQEKRSRSFDANTDLPTWNPDYPFSYAVANIPARTKITRDLRLNQFTDVKHLADGSNAIIYLAKLHGATVIIKMMEENKMKDAIVSHEFDVELGLLARIDHPHIVRALGAGKDPQKFLVLQYLGGGTLKNLFDKTNARKSSLSCMCKSPKTFTFPEVLLRAKELAQALNYLHVECHPEATLIHRDLKPDNVAFLEDGTLMLFDLGLCTVVKRCATIDTVYEMTGGTGSLRYMAPEVALNKPYNEKCDLYSFGVLLWQMVMIDSIKHVHHLYSSWQCVYSLGC